jgi:hypothetical protein
MECGAVEENLKRMLLFAEILKSAAILLCIPLLPNSKGPLVPGAQLNYHQQTCS